MILGLTPTDEEKILSVLRQFANITEVIVFGSRAMGNYKQGSDIDLAVKGQLQDGELARLKGILEESLPLPYFFDLVDYISIGTPALKKHIDEFGKQIYKKFR